VRRQQTNDVVAPKGRKRPVKRCYLPAVSARQAKQVPIRHLLPGSRRPNLLEQYRRYRVGPPNVSITTGSQDE
jgi:hypothetical protein